MSPLFVVVEGQTEEAFVKQVLTPHLAGHHVQATAIIVTTSRQAHGKKHKGGGGNWDFWRNDIRRLWLDRRPEVRVTTLLDLYRLPKNFPELEKHGPVRDTARRCDELERAMADDVHERRFVPYIQRHEVESLVLAALPCLKKLLDTEADRRGLDGLEADIGDFAPEDVNEGAETAPSKRLERFIPSYQKTVHGPLVLGDAGLPALRAKCPRFSAWIQQLEALGEQQS